MQNLYKIEVIFKEEEYLLYYMSDCLIVVCIWIGHNT